MENNQQQILSEIKTLMASVRNQLEELDAKLALWQQLADPQEADIPIELDSNIDVLSVGAIEIADIEPVVEIVEAPVVEAPVVEAPALEELVDDEQVFEEAADELVVVEPADEPVETESVVNEPVMEEQMVKESTIVEDEQEVDDLPFFDVPEEIFQPEPMVPVIKKTVEKPAVIDVMTEKHAWRTAIPGSPVKDVRSAIALMDRVLFINNLFGTDAMAFQETLNQINQMQSLDEAVEYLTATHPEWDYNSQVVYSFMMAVRRKVN